MKQTRDADGPFRVAPSIRQANSTMPPARYKNQIFIVFFDGHCPLCFNLVRFLNDRDGYDRLRFASLQSEWSKAFFAENGPPPALDAVLLWDGQQWTKELEAVARIFSVLPGIWKSLALLRRLPKGLRAKCYRFIANRRYQWFGEYKSCRLPSAADHHKFLDLRPANPNQS